MTIIDDLNNHSLASTRKKQNLMKITGTHINYYLICQRKMWLFHNNVQMENNSELVQMGKLIHETTYPRRNARYEEISVAGIKIDFYDPKANIIHEIKKTSSYEYAHELQLQYYIFVLQQHCFGKVKGILEYPEQHQTKEVVLADIDKQHLVTQIEHIESLLKQKHCPPISKTRGCKKCAYHDFCFVTETSET